MTGLYVKGLLVSQKKIGWGWGWLALLVIYTPQTHGVTSESLAPIIYLVGIPIMLVIYYKLRNKWVRNNKYGDKPWMASLTAGFIAYVATSLFLIGGVAITDELKRDKCTELATIQLVNKLAPEILEKTENFGENITPVINQCEYFSKEDTLLMLVHIGWNGPLTGDYYQSNGRLTVANSDEWTWETIGGNTNFKNWLILKGIAGAIVEEVKNE